MNLETFLRGLAVSYLSDEDFQKTVELAGIDWQKLPDFDSVKVVKRYLNKRAEHPHSVAFYDVMDDYNLLENFAELRQIGRDETELAEQFKSYMAEYQFAELGKKLIANPQKGKHLLETFSATELPAAKAFLVGDFMPILYLKIMDDVDKGVARVSIDGFEKLSALIGGFNPKRIIFIEGQTGFGKTVLALNLARNAALTKKVLYVNMEMDLEDMTKRLIVINSKANYQNLYKPGGIHPDYALKGLEEYGLNLSMTDGRSLSLPVIEAMIRRQHAEDGLDFAIIDYDQKIDLPMSKHIPEWKLIQQATVRLEDLAKELGICIIMLTQQNRDGQNSASHRSTFSAHTVLEFRDDETHGPIIDAKKNRHGKADHAVKVIYDRDKSIITELELCQLIQRPEPRQKRR